MADFYFCMRKGQGNTFDSNLECKRRKVQLSEISAVPTTQTERNI